MGGFVMARNGGRRTTEDPQTSVTQGEEANTLLHEDETFQLGFTQIPNIVLYSPNVSPTAKTLYAILLSYSWRAEKCFPGYIRLCEHMQLSGKIVRKYMRELEAVKLLKHKRRGLGLTNIYILLSLKNAKLEAERDMGTVQERDRNPAQERDKGPGKEDRKSKNIQKKNTKILSKGQSPFFSPEGEGPMAIGNTKENATRSRTKREDISKVQMATRMKKPPVTRVEEKTKPESKAYVVGPPLTQEEIDARRKNK